VKYHNDRSACTVISHLSPHFDPEGLVRTHPGVRTHVEGVTNACVTNASPSCLIILQIFPAAMIKGPQSVISLSRSDLK